MTYILCLFGSISLRKQIHTKYYKILYDGITEINHQSSVHKPKNTGNLNKPPRKQMTLTFSPINLHTVVTGD